MDLFNDVESSGNAVEIDDFNEDDEDDDESP